MNESKESIRFNFPRNIEPLVDAMWFRSLLSDGVTKKKLFVVLLVH